MRKFLLVVSLLLLGCSRPDSTPVSIQCNSRFEITWVANFKLDAPHNIAIIRDTETGKKFLFVSNGSVEELESPKMETDE